MSFAYLFAMRPMCGHVTIHDVHEAYHLARGISSSIERGALYTCMGLDHDRVETYYPQVVHLERCLHLNTEPNIKFKFGKWKIDVSEDRFPDI